jgi:tRNA threonylcarbamoyladenosine biosynthesis protein TsaB
MALILNIDSSSENASICIARDGASIAIVENAEQKNHASWMHPAIGKLLQQVECTVHDLDAVAVTAGPGSYTGLRVSMSTAKGLCYALNIPFITENTLRVMALAARLSVSDLMEKRNVLFSPMIDARRMEVFTALFDTDLQEVVKSFALELSNESFSDHLDKYEILFSGNGSKKFQQIATHENAKFLQVDYSAIHLAQLSSLKFSSKDFSDIIYTEPLYLKEFYTVSKK